MPYTVVEWYGSCFHWSSWSTYYWEREWWFAHHWGTGGCPPMGGGCGGPVRSCVEEGGPGIRGGGGPVLWGASGSLPEWPCCPDMGSGCGGCERLGGPVEGCGAFPLLECLRDLDRPSRFLCGFSIFGLFDDRLSFVALSSCMEKKETIVQCKLCSTSISSCSTQVLVDIISTNKAVQIGKYTTDTQNLLRLF